jgi:hypothetical protein
MLMTLSCTHENGMAFEPSPGIATDSVVTVAVTEKPVAVDKEPVQPRADPKPTFADVLDAGWGENGDWEQATTEFIAKVGDIDTAFHLLGLARERQEMMEAFFAG